MIHHASASRSEAPGEGTLHQPLEPQIPKYLMDCMRLISFHTAMHFAQELLDPIEEAPVPTTVSDIPAVSAIDNNATAGPLVTRSPSSSFNAGYVRNQLSENVSEVQADIDILRELFSNDSLGIPQDTFMDVSVTPSPSSSVLML